MFYMELLFLCAKKLTNRYEKYRFYPYSFMAEWLYQEDAILYMDMFSIIRRFKTRT